MKRVSSPHEYLKRDHSDYCVVEVELKLHEWFGMSLREADAREDFPPPDYVHKGVRFWWASAFESWLMRAFPDYKAQVLHRRALIDTKFESAKVQRGGVAQ